VARMAGSSGRRSRKRRVSGDGDRAGRVEPGASGRSATRTIQSSGPPKAIHPVPQSREVVVELPIRFDEPLAAAPPRPSHEAKPAMPDPTDSSLDRPPAGHFYSTWGPLYGPILRRDEPPALGIFSSPDRPMPIGIAFSVGQVEHSKGPAATFRLVVGKHELEGLYLCIGRQFVKLGESADPL
jgi:hypothetical protein